MNKTIKIILGVLFLLIVFGIIIPIIIKPDTNNGEMLPPPPKDGAESEKLLNDARSLIDESEKLLSQTKNMDLSNYGFFDKIFVKWTTWKMQREINSAKESLNNAEKSHSVQDYYAVSASIYSVSGKTSYANHNLRNLLAGKTRKDWTRVDSVTISST